MKKAKQTPCGSGFLFTGMVAVTCALVGLANTASAQTLQLEIPFTDTGPGTTAVATTSLLGPLSLNLVNNAGAAADFHGVPGSGIVDLGVALDFSTNADFTGTAPGEGSVAGNGPLASVTSTALNFGVVTSFTASMWFNPNAELSYAVTTGPRMFILGANGVTDKASANTIGLYYQQSNEVSVTVNTTEIDPATGTTGPVIASNQWYFFAITFDGTTVTEYEGTEASSAVVIATSTAVAGQSIILNSASGSTLQIGNRANRARPFDGWINDFRFYTGAASSGQIEDLRFAGANLPGMGGANQLVDPGFELSGYGTNPAKYGWTAAGDTPVIETPGPTYYNSAGGVCAQDPTAEPVSTHSGTNVANIYGNFTGGYNTSSWSQAIATAPGAVWTAGAWTYASHEDLMANPNSFYYAVNFRDGSGNLLTRYQSFIVTNLTCGETTPFPVDTWTFLAVTNEIQVTGGVATGTVIGTIPTGELASPVGAQSVQFEALFVQQPGYAGGSIYLDDANLGFVTGAIPPNITAVTPNLITLCTNTNLTCTVSSSTGVITNVVVTVITSALGGTVLTTNTYGLTSPLLTVNSIGTSTAAISFALTSNILYNSVIVKATDNNGINVSSTPVSFDTLAPALVIEASDYNYNGGQFLDTPPNGGLGLYAGLVGQEYIDFVKTGAQNTLYYRTTATPPYTLTIQPGAPGAGGTGTEQKFVSAAASGDTNVTDITEYELGYNAAGDWVDYTRDYGPGSYSGPSSVSAPAGVYNVWTYVATINAGICAGLYQIAGDPTSEDQVSNFVGYIGSQAFADNGWNTYKYAPLTDQFGNLASITMSNGPQTLREQMIGNVNLGFYMLMPAATILTPTLQYLYPEGLHPFEYTNRFVATVGPANGAPIQSMDLVLNGIDVTANSTITQLGSSWTITYPVVLNTPYSGGTLTVSNTAGLSSIFTIVPFDTFNINNYQWEAVDYDFSVGGTGPSDQYIDNPVPTGDITSTTLFTGSSATNSYYFYPADVFGNAALQGVDIVFGNAGQPANPYRADGVGTQPTSDYVRPKFLAARAEFGNQNIGPFNLGYYAAGYWLNYTRDYPPGTYNIFGRLAGGAGPFSGTTLSVVTNGVGTAMQSSNVLGSFTDTNAAGWQAWHWVPLMSNGAPAVVSLSAGPTTLTVTSGNNINSEFFMLVAAPPGLSASLANGNILISFPTATGFSYQVWKSPSLSPASWSPVGSPIPGTGSVVISTNSISGQQGYFQVSTQ